jgi:hypothetical protein
VVAIPAQGSRSPSPSRERGHLGQSGERLWRRARLTPDVVLAGSRLRGILVTVRQHDLRPGFRLLAGVVGLIQLSGACRAEETGGRMRGARGALSYLRSEVSGCCICHRDLVCFPFGPLDSPRLLTGADCVATTGAAVRCRDALPVEASAPARDTQVILCRAGGGA